MHVLFRHHHHSWPVLLAAAAASAAAAFAWAPNSRPLSHCAAKSRASSRRATAFVDHLAAVAVTKSAAHNFPAQNAAVAAGAAANPPLSARISSLAIESLQLENFCFECLRSVSFPFCDRLSVFVCGSCAEAVSRRVFNQRRQHHFESAAFSSVVQIE